jgi:hypothetical protein
MSDFTPENDLEQALVRAAHDPAARPAFYRCLLDAVLFLVTPDAPARKGPRTLESDTAVSLLSFERPRGLFTPIFSSQARVAEVCSRMPEPVGYLGLKGRDAFPLLAQREQAAVLNPGLPYGKEFTVKEIRRLATGNIELGASITVHRPTEVILGQPSRHPQALVDALARLFAGLPSVEAAHLAQIHDPASDLPPHPIIGIVCNEYRQVVPQAGLIADGLAGGPVDFVQLDRAHAEGAADYLLRETKPFYQRRSKPRWKFW